MPIAAKHFGFSPGNTLVDQGDGLNDARQVGNQRIISVDDALEGFILLCQRRPADKRTF